jgi:tetratricopeptide (TPR) repeat protein
VDILQYLIEHSSWFPSEAYTELYADLRRSPYIKDLPEAQHHLLHDEIRDLIQEHVLGEMVGVARDLWEEVQRVVVEAYYTQAIAAAQGDGDGATPSPGATGTTELERQLRAERFGYALDDVRYARVPEQPGLHAEGMASYQDLVKEIVATKDYAFEELVWSEVREYLHALPAAVVEHAEMTETYHNRGNFLLRHSLFRKLEQHYLEFTRQFGEEQPVALFYLAFAQLRQGDLTKAQVAAQKAQTLIPPADHVRQAQIASIRGQITRADGRWEEAAAHYERAVDEAIEANDDLRLASALVNRAFLWAQQADYVLARRECERAIDLLEGLGEETSRRRIYAHMNLATAYRYEGEHEQARTVYQESLDRAQRADDEAARCEVLAHLGINEHLAGRRLRRELLESGVCKVSAGGVPSECQAAFNGASGLQLRAWEYLMQALEIAQPTEWFRAIADAYHRLAKVYREIYRLDDLLADAQEGLQAPEALVTLKQKAKQYVPRFEPAYEGRLLTETEFSKLGFWGRAVRLFDLSWLLAIEANDTHRALDALTEMARMAFEQRQPDVLELVIEIVETQAGYGYMETLFGIMNEIAQGDLYFIRWERDQSAERQRFLDRALEQYQAGFVHLAQQSGYANYLLFDRLRDLRWRLDFLSRDQALHWLRALRDAWRPQLRRNEKWPRILAFLQEEHYKHRKRIA